MSLNKAEKLVMLKEAQDNLLNMMIRDREAIVDSALLYLREFNVEFGSYTTIKHVTNVLSQLFAYDSLISSPLNANTKSGFYFMHSRYEHQSNHLRTLKDIKDAFNLQPDDTEETYDPPEMEDSDRGYYFCILKKYLSGCRGDYTPSNLVQRYIAQEQKRAERRAQFETYVPNSGSIAIATIAEQLQQREIINSAKNQLRKDRQAEIDARFEAAVTKREPTNRRERIKKSKNPKLAAADYD